MGITALIPLVGGLTSLASEFIEDPDKKAEFETRKYEIEQQLLIALSQQTTTPFADSTVKIITALVALARPIGSFGLFIFGLFNIELMQQLASMGTAGELAVGATFGAAPGWIASRHVEKVQKAKQPGFIDH